MAQVIRHEALRHDEISVAYVRASSKKNEQVESYHAQFDYWTKKPFIERVYGDKGISGKRQSNRDEFKQLMVDAKLGKFKTIYTKSVTRFGRNNIETVQAIQELRAVGVNVVFETENLDTKNLSNELFIKIRTILAEKESDSISENVKWSYKRRYRKGILNWINGCYGYDIDETYNWTINEEQANVVRRIFNLYVDGCGFSKIVKLFKSEGLPSPTGNDEWAPNSLRRIISNEKYVGEYLLQKTMKVNGKQVRNKGELPTVEVKNCHEPIISRELFDQAQAIRKQRGAHVQENIVQVEYEFTGKIQCGLCEKKFKRRINHKIKNFSPVTWVCATSDLHGVSACRANQIGDELIKELALCAFNEYLTTPKVNDNVAQARAEIAELVGKEKGLRDLLSRGLITFPQFTAELATIKSEFERLDALIENEQGDGLYTKSGAAQEEFTEEITNHIERVIMRGYKITFIFRNKQEITRRYKYEHRRYLRDDD